MVVICMVDVEDLNIVAKQSLDDVVIYYVYYDYDSYVVMVNV